MRQRIRAIRTNESGFTLIELLIVIVILGVLAGIVVFAVQNFNGQGVQAACKTDVKTVETASEAYYAQKGTYAGDIATLVTSTFLKDTPPTAMGPGNYYLTYTIPAGGVPVVGGFYRQGTNAAQVAC